MKKPMEQLKEIMGVSEERPAVGWAFVFILILLSSIFDYGCKLQQESDETL